MLEILLLLKAFNMASVRTVKFATKSHGSHSQTQYLMMMVKVCCFFFFFFGVMTSLNEFTSHGNFRVHVFQECKQNLSFHEGNHNWNLTQLGESIDKVAYLISPVFFPIHMRNYIYILWVCKCMNSTHSNSITKLDFWNSGFFTHVCLFSLIANS